MTTTAWNRRPSSSGAPRNLPIQRFHGPVNLDSALSIESCAICLEGFPANSCSVITVNELPCHHSFHRDCISKWLARSNTCPLCRSEFPVELRREEGRNDQSAERQRVQLRLAPRAERPLRRVLAVQSLMESGAPDGDRVVLSANYGIRNGSGYDSMRDEDEEDGLSGAE